AWPVDRAPVVVIAQVAHEVGHVRPPGPVEEATARVVSGLGAVAGPGVLEGGPEVEASPPRRPPPPALGPVRLDARRRLLPVVGDGRQVRDGGPATDPSRDPVPPRGL